MIGTKSAGGKSVYRKNSPSLYDPAKTSGTVQNHNERIRKTHSLLTVVVADSSVENVGPNPEPVMQSVSSSSHAPGTLVTSPGGGTTVGGT